MNTLVERFLALRIWPLILKELRQLRRNRRLVISLVIPPTIQIILAGFAFNAEVTQLRLGVLDESRSFESRELVSSFSESRAFRLAGYYTSPEEVGLAISAGDLDAALTIPVDFAKRRMRGETAEIQVLIDAVNSNTASIASDYVSLIVRSLNEKFSRTISIQQSIGPTNLRQALPAETPFVFTGPGMSTTADSIPSLGSRVLTHITLLFNPALEHSWFIITGILGTLVVLNGSVVASASIIKEREVGTIDQLLMTPAGAGEIIVSKVASLMLLLLGQLALALIIGRLIFNIPVRGSLALLLLGGTLCLSVGIGIGLAVAAITHNQQQAQLLGFFINPVIGILSGALTPLEAMPKWMQAASELNPVKHFAIITRGILIKGVGASELYPNLLILFGLMVFLLTFSIWRLRKHIV